MKITDQLVDICKAYSNLNGVRKYKKINQDVRTAMPDLFNAAQTIALTEDRHTNRGARTCHYYNFDYSAADFVTDQELRLALFDKRRLNYSDPWIGRAPSKDELLVTIMLRMVGIIDMNISDAANAA